MKKSDKNINSSNVERKGHSLNSLPVEVRDFLDVMASSIAGEVRKELDSKVPKPPYYCIKKGEVKKR